MMESRRNTDKILLFTYSLNRVPLVMSFRFPVKKKKIQFRQCKNLNHFFKYFFIYARKAYRIFRLRTMFDECRK